MATGFHELLLCIPHAVWLTGSVVFLFSTPFLLMSLRAEYYRQTPPKVPNFLRTLFRRKLVLWFLASGILRDYWLSGVSLLRTCQNVSVMVFCLIALWSQLDFPLERTHSQVANFDTPHRFLCWGLDSDVGRIDSFQ